MIAYPVSLPCVSRIEGHAATAYAGLVRTPMEAGNTRQRRTQRVLPHRISLVFVMAQEVYADWLTWVNANAFDNWFTLALPGLLASRAGASTALVPVRFMSDVSSELLPVHRLWYWRCRVEAEWMPTAADLVAITFGDWIAADFDDQAQTWPAPVRKFDFTTGALDSVITFTRGSPASYWDGAGVLRTAGADVALFDHDPVTHAALGLLIETAAINYVPQSQNIAVWTKGGGRVQASPVLAPDGTASAVEFIEDTSSTAHYVGNSVAVTAGGAYTLSAFVKAGVGNRCAQLLLTSSAFGVPLGATFDLSTGATAVTSGATAAAVAVGGGWWRVSITATATLTASSSSVQCRTYPSLTGVVSSYPGDGTSSLLWWGVQMEDGLLATSYIATSTVAILRAQDVAVVTGANFSSWWRQDEGAVAAVCVGRDVVPSTGGHVVYAAQGATFSELNQISLAANLTISRWNLTATGVNQLLLDFAPHAQNQATSIIAAYRLNDCAVQADNGPILTDTSATMPAPDRLYLGGNSSGGALLGTLASFTYYAQRLPLGAAPAVAVDWVIAGTPATPSSAAGVAAGTPIVPSASV